MSEPCFEHRPNPCYVFERYLETWDGEPENALVFRFDVGQDDNLLGHDGDKTGVGQSLDDGDVKVGVDLFLDLVNVADSQTVENVHEHNHQEVDEADKDDIAQPVVKLQVSVVHLTSEHDQSLDQGETHGAK